MSVRAYKIKKIEWEENPSFNLWHDDKLMFLIEKTIDLQLDESGSGYIEIPVETLKEVVPKLKGTKEEDRIKYLQRDIRQAEANGDSHIEYMCF